MLITYQSVHDIKLHIDANEWELIAFSHARECEEEIALASTHRYANARAIHLEIFKGIQKVPMQPMFFFHCCRRKKVNFLIYEFIMNNYSTGEKMPCEANSFRRPGLLKRVQRPSVSFIQIYFVSIEFAFALFVGII